MKNVVRLPALIFAALSALYWSGVQAFWMLSSTAYANAYAQKPPLAIDLTVTATPTAIYMLVCVLFCHWLALRVARHLSKSEGQ